MRELIDAVWPDYGITSLLDLGCGDLWFTDHLVKEKGVNIHVGLDLHEPSLEKARAKNIPNIQLLNMDIREYLRLRAEAVFDAVLAIDVIEHFNEDEAKWLIGEIPRVAKHIAIIWTTLGYMEQGPYDINGEPNKYQEHFYGPTVDDFTGWTVDTYPDWHGARGGGIFAHKIIEPIPVRE